MRAPHCDSVPKCYQFIHNNVFLQPPIGWANPTYASTLFRDLKPDPCNVAPRTDWVQEESLPEDDPHALAWGTNSLRRGGHRLLGRPHGICACSPCFFTRMSCHVLPCNFESQYATQKRKQFAIRSSGEARWQALHETGWAARSRFSLAVTRRRRGTCCPRA